jgi:hypothetical protein
MQRSVYKSMLRAAQRLEQEGAVKWVSPAVVDFWGRGHFQGYEDPVLSSIFPGVLKCLLPGDRTRGRDLRKRLRSSIGCSDEFEVLRFLSSQTKMRDCRGESQYISPDGMAVELNFQTGYIPPAVLEAYNGKASQSNLFAYRVAMRNSGKRSLWLLGRQYEFTTETGQLCTSIGNSPGVVGFTPDSAGPDFRVQLGDDFSRRRRLRGRGV